MDLRTTFRGLLSIKIAILVLLTSLPATELSAQKVSYFDLARQNRGQNFYFKRYALPGKTDSTTTFALIFKTAHSFLTFKKLGDKQLNPADTAQYFATLEMNIEVFKNPPNASDSKKNKKGDFSQQGLESVGRSFWKDTVFTKNYEQTQTPNLFIEGFFEMQLKPGNYGYILQLIRTEGANEETSRQQTVNIPEYGENNGTIYLLENSASMDDGKLNLINFGSNAHFGKDFNLLVHFPAYNPFRDYELTIKKRVENNIPDSLREEPIFRKTIARDMVTSNIELDVVGNREQIALELNNVPDSETYAFVSVPNSSFPNASYTVTLTDKEIDEVIARTVYQSRWVNIPTSLLNVDVALKMLRFILPEKQIKQMRDGSRAQKQKAFENFWNPKDPTPDTEYNELMAEYYRRIDYAFRNFSSFTVPGYETDQGNIYIRKGPPNKIDRKFPLNQPVVEIWRYDDKTFIFEATSGFGDFKLIETQSS